MALKDVLANSPDNNWTNDLEALGKYPRLSNRESETLFKAFRKAVPNKDSKSGSNLAAVGLVLDCERFLASVRKRGVLRPSRYDFQIECVSTIVDGLLKSKLPEIVDDRTTTYLHSIVNLCALAEDAKARRDKILGALDVGRESTLKSLLVAVELMFQKAAWFGLTHGGDADDSSDYDFFTFDQRAEALSYIFFLYQENFGPINSAPMLDLDKFSEHTELLYEAAHVRAVFEMETQIDSFDYSLKKKRDNEFELAPPSLEFERSIRLGYVQTEMQDMAGFDRHATKGASLRAVAGKLFYDMGGKGVQRLENPDRFAFALPGNPKAWEPLKTSDLFVEEHISLRSAERTYLTPLAKLMQFEVTKDVTVEDMVHFQRILNFIRWFSAPHLMEIFCTESDDKPIAIKSMIPFYPRAGLSQILEFVLPADKAKKLIELFTWNTKEPPVFDIQYQPLIEVVDKGFMIPMNIAGESNVIRSAMQLMKARLYEEGTEDPVVDLLHHALSKKTKLVKANCNFEFKSQRGEIDVAAVLGDCLFVHECKNSLLPTGAHELRTSWDYIQKADSQLSFVKINWDENKGFREYLEYLLGFDLSGVKKVQTCAVMSNRMFQGYRTSNGNPVRGLFDLVHLLEEGTAVMGEESHCFWENKEFASNDYVRYLSEDIVYQHQWNAMRPYVRTYNFGGWKVERHTLITEMKKVAEGLGFGKAVKHFQKLEDEHAESKKQVDELQ